MIVPLLFMNNIITNDCHYDSYGFILYATDMSVMDVSPILFDYNTLHASFIVIDSVIYFALRTGKSTLENFTYSI